MSSISCNCIVCMEEFTTQDGLFCQNGHFICNSDLTSYLSENIFPYSYKLRENACFIGCPVPDCECNYNAIQLFDMMQTNEKTRFITILDDTIVKRNLSKITLLRNVLLDVLTLACPNCKTPVDPYPDACSAILCLSCGNYYCNYCFKSFTDSAQVHKHTAEHNPAENLEERDAFLSLELIKLGQKKYQIKQLERCLSLAMCSIDYGTNGRHDVALGLILCINELNDLDINILTIWKSAEHLAGNNISVLNLNDTIINIDPSLERRIQGATQLSNAIITSNNHAIDQIINSYSEPDSFDVNYVDPKHGFPLLSLAIINKYDKLAIELINRGANPLICNRNGRNALYIVIELGDIDVLKHIILMNPSIDLNIPVTTEDNCYYPIHVAAKFNRGHLISYLRSLNVDINQLENELSYTPLLIALVLGHEWTVFELMKEGADIHIPTKNGRTALYVVAEKDMTTCNRIIYIAALYDNSHIISLLISHNVEVNYINKNVSFTPLMVCIMRKNIIGALALLNAGADVHVIHTGRNLMYFAIEQGLSEIIRVLVTEYNFLINDPCTLEKGLFRPIHIAITLNKIELLPLLLELGANIDLLDDDRLLTPLHHAALQDNAMIVKFLIDNNANPSIMSKAGITALFIAISKGNTSITRLIIEKCYVNVDSINICKDKMSCLHVAAMYDRSNVITQLLAMNIDINIIDYLGRKAIDIAQNNSLYILQNYI